MPLTQVSEKTKKELERLKKELGCKSEDRVIWNGLKEVDKKQSHKITEPTMDFDIFKKSEDFSL